MSIQSSANSFAPAASRLLLENFQLSVRKPVSSSGTQSIGRKTSSDQPSLARITSRVEQIRDRLLDAARSAESGHSLSLQSTIDDALGEISLLMGSPLYLGGADNAVFKTLNADQIVDAEVLALPPGASQLFSGSVSRDRTGATTRITESGKLLSSGGTLLINASGRESTVRVRAGSSLDDLARSINRRGLGVRALATREGLQLTTTNRGRNASLQVLAKQRTRVNGYEDASIMGQNESQILSVQTNGLTPGQSITVNGSRDSVATAAELVYQGDFDGNVTGSVSFDLVGSLGSATVSMTKGESLVDVASRVSAVTDVTGVTAEVIGNELLLRSTTEGEAATVMVTNVDHEYETSTSGVNAAQLADFELLSIDDNSEVVISGTVTQAADSAEQTYHGGAGGTVTSSATFTLTGVEGSSQFVIIAGESITDVAQRINDLSETTGVIASTSGNDLIFRSADVGSAQSVNVTLDSVENGVNVLGVNPSEIDDFQVNSTQPGSSNTLEIDVEGPTQAELRYTGSNGQVDGDATFTLSGELGETLLAVLNGQSLASLRNAINAETANTGVTATLNGNDLFLRSTEYGSTETVSVDVLLGSFDTSGGDGNGNAVGEDAVVEINGTEITANGNDVDYSDALGSYSFTLVAGVSGPLDPITIESSDGTFDVVGGDAGGTAYGIDATATLNGQQATGTGNDFHTTIESAEITFTLEPEFTGTLDPITVRSDPAAFDVTGGDGNGNAVGQNGTATINGQTVSSADDLFAFSVGGGTITLTFAEDHLGAFDELTVTAASEPVYRSAGTSQYSAKGTDQKVIVNGQELSSVDGRYIVKHEGIAVALKFAKGFSGTFDSFSVSAGGLVEATSFAPQLTDSLLEPTQQALASLFVLATGGRNSGEAANLAESLSIAIESVGRLRAISGTQRVVTRSLLGALFDQRG